MGYPKYMAAGGRHRLRCYQVSTDKHPEALMGIHLTDVGIIRELVLHDQSPEFSFFRRESSKMAFEWLTSEAGYMRVHVTKPQTLVVGLSDSPVGLVAWILEKFHSWRDLQSSLSLD